jgi:hypothetical protein
MIGRAPSSANFRSICYNSCLRFSWSASIDCRLISWSTSALHYYTVQLRTAPVKQVQILVGIGPASRPGERDDIVLAHDRGNQLVVSIVSSWPSM